MRTGLIGKKIGMTRIFTEAGEHIPVTVLEIDSCKIVGHKTIEQHGYSAVQVGYGVAKEKNLKKPVRGFYAKAKLPVNKYIAEFKVNPDSYIDVGAELDVNHFKPGAYVDVVGQSIGKGFAGPMKRHNFAGNRASHGVSLSHRSHGSTGQCQDPGKVFKGKKMAGHYGDQRTTVHNLQIVQVDMESKLIFIKGSVPGAKGSYIKVRDAIKKKAS